MVLHDSPAWAPSSTSSSNSPSGWRWGTPHSVSWYSTSSGRAPVAQPQRGGSVTAARSRRLVRPRLDLDVEARGQRGHSHGGARRAVVAEGSCVGLVELTEGV